VDENIFYMSLQKEVNMSSLHHQEGKEMIKLFHIKIQVKKTKIDVMLEFVSQANVIALDLVSKIGLEVEKHPNPYPLGWISKDANIKETKQCNIKFVVSVDFIDEVELYVVPLDVCGVVFGIPYMYMRDAIFMRKANQY
jgi:hypothetical protein